MGLDDLIPEETDSGSNQLRKYGSHEADEKLENWIDEFQSRFPTDVRIDFIEVSPELTKSIARWYVKPRDGEEVRYVRVSEKLIDMEEWYQRQVILSVMSEMWMNQMGAKEMEAGHAIKKWVKGQVGCIINAVDVESEEWRILAEPFIDEDLKR